MAQSAASYLIHLPIPSATFSFNTNFGSLVHFWQKWHNIHPIEQGAWFQPNWHVKMCQKMVSQSWHKTYLRNGNGLGTLNVYNAENTSTHCCRAISGGEAHRESTEVRESVLYESKVHIINGSLHVHFSLASFPGPRRSPRRLRPGNEANFSHTELLATFAGFLTPVFIACKRGEKAWELGY